MRTNREIIEALKQEIESVRIHYNIPLDKINKGIMYANGNDGTEFDVFMNDNLCELGKVYVDTNEFAIRCYVRGDGKLQIFAHPIVEGKVVDWGEEIIVYDFITLEEFKNLASYLVKYTDNKNIYDKELDESTLDKRYKKLFVRYRPTYF